MLSNRFPRSIPEKLAVHVGGSAHVVGPVNRDHALGVCRGHPRVSGIEVVDVGASSGGSSALINRWRCAPGGALCGYDDAGSRSRLCSVTIPAPIRLLCALPVTWPRRTQPCPWRHGQYCEESRAQRRPRGVCSCRVAVHLHRTHSLVPYGHAGAWSQGHYARRSKAGPTMGQGSEDRAQGGAVAAPRRVGRDLSCHKARHTAPGAPGLSLSGALLRFLMIGHGGRIHTAIDRGGNVSALTIGGGLWRGRCDQRGGPWRGPWRGLCVCKA